MFKKSDTRQSKLFAGLAGLSALALLTACSADGPADDVPADQEVEQQTVQPEESAPVTSDDTTTEDAGADTDVEATGTDPVFDIIDAVEAEYSGGFIVQIDFDDNSTYDVDVVVGDELYELDVTASGDISVDERDDDDDKIEKANRATVTVTDALNQAFDQHPDARFDQIDLDDDDNSVEWEIDLDGADGSDIEMTIPAL